MCVCVSAFCHSHSICSIFTLFQPFPSSYFTASHNITFIVLMHTAHISFNVYANRVVVGYIYIRLHYKWKTLFFLWFRCFFLSFNGIFVYEQNDVVLSLRCLWAWICFVDRVNIFNEMRTQTEAKQSQKKLNKIHPRDMASDLYVLMWTFAYTCNIASPAMYFMWCHGIQRRRDRVHRCLPFLSFFFSVHSLGGNLSMRENVEKNVNSDTKRGKEKILKAEHSHRQFM